MQLFTKWYVKYILLALCCAVLLVVPLLRGPLIGTEPFFTARLAAHPSWHDDLSFGGRFAAYAWGTPLVLSPAPSVLMAALPFLLGIASVLLFSSILNSFIEDKRLKYLSLLFLILSPSFIYTFSFPNSLFLPVFLVLAAASLFFHKRYSWWSLPIFVILPLFSILITTACLIVLFCYTLWKKEQQKVFLALLFGALLSGALYYGYIFYNTGWAVGLSLGEGKAFQLFSTLFYDFGTLYGLGIFLTLLATIGILSKWEKKYANLFLFLSLSFLIVVSFFRQETLVLLNLMVVPFAAQGFMFLAELRWTSKHFKMLTLLAFVCGIVFSGISQMDALTEAKPDAHVLNAIQFLSEQEQGTVFSHQSRGAWIAASGQKNMIDEQYLFVPDAEKRFWDAEILYSARTKEEIYPILTAYDIKYVWIDDEMKGILWDYQTEGLLFVLEYSRDFTKIYDEGGVEIWKLT